MLTLSLRQMYLRLLYFYRSSKRWLHRSIERISMNIDSVAQSADPLCHEDLVGLLWPAHRIVAELKGFSHVEPQ